MDNLPPVLFLGGALVFLEYLIVAVVVYYRRPLLASGVILGAFVLEAAFISLPGFSAGISLYVPDLVFLPVLLAGLIRCALPRALPVHSLLLFGLLFVFLVSLARGIDSFGIARAGNESRSYFYFLAGALYFSTVTFSRMELARLVRQWLLACGALVGIVTFRWMGTLSGIPIAQSWEQFASGPGGGSFRVLHSSHAMTIAVGMLLSLQLNLANEGKSWERNLVYLLMPVVLVLQHRTVWLVCIAGMAWLLSRQRAYRQTLITWMGVTGFAGLTLFILFGAAAESQLTTALEASSTNTGTLEWRIEGWRQLLSSEQGSSPLDRLIGLPFGSGFERMMSGYVVEVSPHNFYVQTYLRLGIIGVSLFALAYILAFRQRPMRDSGSSVPGGYPLAIWDVALMAQLVYFFTYAPSFEQGIILGVSLGAAVHVRRWHNQSAQIQVDEGYAWQ